MGAEMTNNLQVPWTDEQWARVNQVIQEEATRARVAATFLPLYGPLPGDTDFVRRETISYTPNPQPPPPQQLTIRDRDTIQLATLQVKVFVRSAQIADSEMRSVLSLFRRAANVLARLEDAVIFRGLVQAPSPAANLTPVGSPANLPPPIWEIRGGEVSDGLLSPPGSLTIPVPATAQALVQAVSEGIGQLEASGHFGPFAVVLDQNYFETVQTPDAGSLVLPQDRIIPFLGGGSLLRSSTLPGNSGIVVALGGAPVELVVATDMSLQFLQVTPDPRFLFRVREKIALRMKEADAILTLAPSGPSVWAVSPSTGPVAGGIPVNVWGLHMTGATAVRFGSAPPVTPAANSITDKLITNLTLPASPLPGGAPGTVPVTVTTPQGTSAVTTASQFTYV
jgi:uncharacterized linocin/CFP29 family protein